MLRSSSILLSFTMLLFCGLQTAASEDAPDIKIGVIQSLTGIAAEYGKTITQSLQLAADDINSSGTAHVTLVIEDDRTQAKDAVAAFQKLSSQGVSAVVGASWDFTTNSILPLAARNKVVVFNTSTIKESLNLEQSQGYGFTNGFLAEDEVKPFVRFLEKNPAKRAAIVYANNSWGEIQRRTYSATLTRHKVEIAQELKPSSYDENEWTSLIPRIRATNADLILLLLNRSDVEVFIRKANEQRVASRFYVSVNGYDALRLASDKSQYNGICFSYPLEQLHRDSAFASRYEKRFGEPPRIYADATYDSVYILVDAARRAKALGISLQESLQATSYQGLVGKYFFNEASSLCIQQDSLVCVRNGATEVVP